MDAEIILKEIELIFLRIPIFPRRVRAIYPDFSHPVLNSVS